MPHTLAGDKGEPLFSAEADSSKESTAIRPDVHRAIFRDTSHLIGESLPHIELKSTPSPSRPNLPRHIDISSTHANSIICILPAMYDARLERRNAMWRAGWEEITGGYSCQTELKTLERNIAAIRANGLSLAIVSGQSIPTVPVKERGVDLRWDQEGSFTRMLGLPALRYQGEAFHPRVTMLVQNGKVVRAFSATKDFTASLKELLSLTQQSASTSDKPH
jgi:peroxiredoxin